MYKIISKEFNGNVVRIKKTSSMDNKTNSLIDIIKSHRAVITDWTSVDIKSYPEVSSLSKKERCGINTFPYLFWHFDHNENGVIALASSNFDYNGQPNTIFSDISDVTKRIIEISPEFISQLERNYQLPKLNTDSSLVDLLLDTFENFRTITRPWRGEFQTNPGILNDNIVILRDSIYAFSKLLVEFDEHDDLEVLTKYKRALDKFKIDGEEINLGASIFTLFGYIPEIFQQLDICNEFMANVHNIENSYKHFWKPGEIVFWSGEDYSLLHSRIPQENTKYVEMNPLYRFFLKYENL